MAMQMGQQLGKYRLMHLLGRGGFADVYLGIHVHLGTQAAIKVLTTRLAPEDVERFRSEARTIARLAHPHIVRVLDFGVEQSVPFLVMDYAPNGTLRARSPAGTQLSPAEILPYVRQIAEALQYAHEQKLVHRDIKPENLLLGSNGEVLLSDFGIAIGLQSSQSRSLGEAVGTIAYMAPEQIQGKALPASDQYSLGIIIYEWLTGERPFTGTYTQVALQHLFTPPSSLRQKLPKVGEGLEQAVMIALSKNPKERFSSVRAFLRALEHAYSQEPSEVQVSPPALPMPAASQPAEPPRTPGFSTHLPPLSSPPTASTPEPALAMGDQETRLSHPGSPGRRRPRRLITIMTFVLVGLILGASLGVFLSRRTTAATKPSLPPMVAITEFSVPTLHSVPFGVTRGTDGNIWFTESSANQIGYLSPKGVFKEFPIPTPNSGPLGLRPGSDGNIWFTENLANQIGVITPAGAVKEYPVPTPRSGLYRITIGSDGNLWFTENIGNRIGRVTPAGEITEFSVPTTNSRPYGITPGPASSLWFAEFDGNKIGKITATGDITEFPLPTPRANPTFITAGSDGNLWFTEYSGNKVGRMTPDGVFTEFPIPTPRSQPLGITVGPDSNFWFTESNGDKIARMTSTGVFTEFPVPTPNSLPLSLAVGADNNLWFPESAGNKIGRLTLPKAHHVLAQGKTLPDGCKPLRLRDEQLVPAATRHCSFLRDVEPSNLVAIIFGKPDVAIWPDGNAIRVAVGSGHLKFCDPAIKAHLPHPVAIGFRKPQIAL